MSIASSAVPKFASAGPAHRLSGWLRLAGYVVLFVAVLALITVLIIFPWIKTWGATPVEVIMPLPGDDLVPTTSFETTKAVSVQAAPDQIYPWLLQLGVDRGGMYSYTWIENLMGLHVTNVEEICPEFQQVAVGDFLRFVPTDFPAQPGPGLYVTQMIQNEAFILCFGIEGSPGEPCTSTWQFVIHPKADGSSRLILRNRISDQESWQNTAFGRLFMIPTFVMERKMLLGIKQQAEKLAEETGSIGGSMPRRDDTVGQVDYVSLDNYVRREMEASSMPGVAYAVVQDGEIVHSAAFGHARPDGTPMTVGTPSDIGSVSKVITALAIRQLVESGKIEFDAPVQRYVPWFTLADPDAAAQITIRDLVEHTSGIATLDGQNPVLYREGVTLEDTIRAFATVWPDRPVGTRREYSNFNYVLLGLVIEQVTGQSYDAYVRERIYAPLKMTCYLSQTDAQADGMAMGHRLVFGLAVPEVQPYATGMISAGYHLCSTESLARFTAAISNNGIVNGSSVVTPNSVPPAEPVIYSVDWQPLQIWGSPWMSTGHSGASTVHNAALLYMPYKRWGVVVLTNTYTAQLPIPTADAYSIALGVLDRNFELPPRPSPVRVGFVYIFVDALAVLMIVGTVFHAVRLRDWPKRVSQKALLVMVLIDGFLPLFVIFGLPPLIGTMIHTLNLSPFFNWPMMFAANPDISYTLFVLSVVLLIIGLVKLSVLISHGLRPRHRMTVIQKRV